MVDDEWANRVNAEMAECILDNIKEILTELGVPRGTWGDDQIHNFIAMYNLRGDKLASTSNLLAVAEQELKCLRDIVKTLETVLTDIANWPDYNHEQINAIKLLAASVISPDKIKMLKNLTT